jgi:hypothetical protein
VAEVKEFLNAALSRAVTLPLLMSSVSFPIYDSPFDPSSSFQMNPLSSHPPRTPRASLISSYEVSQPEVEIEKPDEDEDQNEGSEPAAEALQVWREIFITSSGRDKAFVRLSTSDSPARLKDLCRN